MWIPVVNNAVKALFKYDSFAKFIVCYALANVKDQNDVRLRDVALVIPWCE